MQKLNIYEINTATWLRRLSVKYNRAINLADVPSEEWDIIGDYGCTVVWLMGVWQRSPAAIEINRKDAKFVTDMQQVLDDFDFDADVIGSAYSIRNYSVSADLGGDDALAVARQELKKRGIKLLLDYVPNHVAPDHAWATNNPTYFVQGTNDDYTARPDEFMQIGAVNYALGRDPNGAPWSDVLQLNVFSKEFRLQAQRTLASIAQQCDGVRCDMAMLVTNEIFKYTWQALVGDVPQTEYWEELIAATRATNPKFLFIAEAYWDTQDALLGQGFDYCYNKDFYDFVRDDETSALAALFAQPVNVQNRQVRFLENHDEPRAASLLDYKQHTAAAILLATSPSARMYYDGQFDGVKIRTPVQLCRDPMVESNEQLRQFYTKYQHLLSSLTYDNASWQLCSVTALHSVDDSLEAVFAWNWQIADAYYVSITNYSKQSVDAAVALSLADVDITNTSLTVIFSNSGDNSAIAKIPNGLECRLQPYDAMIVSVRRAI